MAYTSPPNPSYYGFTNATPYPSGPNGFDRQNSSPVRGLYPSPRYSSTGCYSTIVEIYPFSLSYSESLEDSEYQVYNGRIYVSRRLRRQSITNVAGTPINGAEPCNSSGYDFNPPRGSRRESPTPQPSTTRRSSYSTNGPSPLKATEADARKHHIPPGYSLEHWDGTEKPMKLLRSVFDLNSLGKWIYDWTVYHHGPASSTSEMAGKLWLLLIQLAGDVKRAEKCMPRIRRKGNREIVEAFIESGDHLTRKLRKLLKAWEAPMLVAHDSYSKGQAQLGVDAGIDFVDSIFGEDRQLKNTKSLIAEIELWKVRFDENCEDVFAQRECLGGCVYDLGVR
jgi:hypothetical protein